MGWLLATFFLGVIILLIRDRDLEKQIRLNPDKALKIIYTFHISQFSRNLNAVMDKDPESAKTISSFIFLGTVERIEPMTSSIIGLNKRFSNGTEEGIKATFDLLISIIEDETMTSFQNDLVKSKHLELKSACEVMSAYLRKAA